MPLNGTPTSHTVGSGTVANGFAAATVSGWRTTISEDVLDVRARRRSSAALYVGTGMRPRWLACPRRHRSPGRARVLAGAGPASPTSRASSAAARGGLGARHHLSLERGGCTQRRPYPGGADWVVTISLGVDRWRNRAARAVFGVHQRCPARQPDSGRSSSRPRSRTFPTVVGVPLMVPLDERDSPGGSAPLRTRYW